MGKRVEGVQVCDSRVGFFAMDFFGLTEASAAAAAAESSLNFLTASLACLAKVRIQKIERRWAREWREYRYVTPKYMKKFTLASFLPSVASYR